MEIVKGKFQFNISHIKLIVGLGNIGQKYEKTRHNVGFDFVDTIAGEDFLEERKFKAFLSTKSLQEKKLILAKPTTMMNLSGESVQLISDYYKIKPEEILVAHDDLDIQFGRFKIQFDKGPKIHNGILSIEKMLGSTYFWRLRIGVDSRNEDQKKFLSGADYVLGKFSSEEKEDLEKVYQNIFKYLKNTVAIKKEENEKAEETNG